jgi:hypothetical protein
MNDVTAMPCRNWRIARPVSCKHDACFRFLFVAKAAREMWPGREEETAPMAEYKTDIEIARAANKKPIMEIGAKLGIPSRRSGSLRP